MSIPSLDVGKENVMWSSQLADELHKPAVKKFRKRKVFANGIDKIWSADLVDMQQFSKFNRSVKYLFAVIDWFSKYGFMMSLKDKTGSSVANAMRELFETSHRKSEKLWVYKGQEFYKKNVTTFAQDLGVQLCSTENEEKSSVVERWNRTWKQ